MADGITALSHAMSADLVELRSISQNLANINTQGYKREVVTATAFVNVLENAVLANEKNIPALSNIVPDLQIDRDLRQGTLKFTDDQFDLAIDGDAFLLLSSDQGERLTRGGRMQIDENGILSLKSGERLQGNSGDIRLEPGEFEIHANGDIQQGDLIVDRLRLVQSDDSTALSYMGQGLFLAPENLTTASESDIRLLQGYTETSNVNMLDEMVRLINVTRHFETSGNVLQGYDSNLDSVINVLGSF